MRLFNFRFIASVGSEFILWNLEGFDKRCVSCRMYSFLSIITNVLFLSTFRMMMLSFLLNSLILLYSSFVIRSLVKSLLSFRLNLFNSHVNLSSFLMVTFFFFSAALMLLESFSISILVLLCSNFVLRWQFIPKENTLSVAGSISSFVKLIYESLFCF